MSKKSIVRNSIYYLIYNVCNLFFPLISGVYVARKLSPESIGQVSYAQNIVQYFVIFALLGIPTYGIREISNARKNQLELNRVYSELFIINLLSTILFFLLYLILIFYFKSDSKTLILYFIVSIFLLANIFDINWLFEGLEEFKFISLRNVAFKVISFFLLVIFVRKPDDYLKFALINTLGTVGNYFINILYAKKYVALTLKDLNFKRHIKSILYLVSVNLAIEIYTLVDVSMLGFFCVKEVVAYYVYGSRIYKILLQIINSFTMVIVPRISLLYAENRKEEFNVLLSQTFKIIILCAVPMIIGIQFTAKELIVLLYGESYIHSVKIIQLMSILLVLTPVGYLLGSRVLLISKHENKMVIAVVLGAVSNTLGNYFLIQKYAQLGAAISTTVSEILVMLVYVFLGRKYFKLIIEKNEYLKIVVSNMVMLLVLIIISNLKVKGNIILILEISLAPIVYFCILFICKEKYVYEKTIKLLKNKVMRVK